MIIERLSALREKLQEKGIDSFIITGTDPHQSEYPADRWKSRAYFSGFTGSAGVMLVTADDALLWTDSRYFIQAENELEGSGIRLMKEGMEGVPSLTEYLKGNVRKKMRVGVDGDTISISSFRHIASVLASSGAELVATEGIISSIWKGQPAMPDSKAYEIDERYAYIPMQKKIAAIRSRLRDEGCRWTFISSLDDIAWILNLRASDVKYNPVFYSYLFISLSKAVLFTDESRLPESFKGIDVRPYEEAGSCIEELARGTGYYSPDKNPASFMHVLSKGKNKEGMDFSLVMKSMKSKGEAEGMRKAHILDGAAYVTFLSKLLSNDGLYDEIMLANMLERERERMEGYIGPSFAPISAFGPHGAIVHYSPSETSSGLIMGHGLLVLDTGSQFMFGTTDVTRTLVFGSDPTEEEKKDYTLVLKGHLALQRQKFPKGTRGVQLDVLAKQFLWNQGENFLHGTGHGVGFHLSVHEGPQRISTALLDIPLMPGMVISDEPGLYKEGRYGIRIENLLIVREDDETEFGAFYRFEPLTMVPYEKKLIDVDMLTDQELEQINSYHKKVYYNLAPYLDAYSSEWLRLASSPMERKQVY